jgi:hypothetical protein
VILPASHLAWALALKSVGLVLFITTNQLRLVFEVAALSAALTVARPGRCYWIERRAIARRAGSGSTCAKNQCH